MACNKCLEWCKTFIKDDAVNSAATTKGTNANKVLHTLADFFCNAKTNASYLKDALNLKLQDDFDDIDKQKIFENVLSQKEQEFDLYKNNIFTVPTDLKDRLELLRLVDAIVREKVQSIDDIKKVLSFLGVDNVEFHFKFPNNFIDKSLVLALWGQSSYENANTWKIFLPTTLLLDTQKKQVIENFILLLKEPHHNYKFYYIL